MASDCSSCLSLQEMSDTIRYGCQWCVDRCQSNSTCGHLQTTSMCPLPDIQEVRLLLSAHMALLSSVTCRAVALPFSLNAEILDR